MAPSPRISSRKDAIALPSMSSTFWAILILASLLIAYRSQAATWGPETEPVKKISSRGSQAEHIHSTVQSTLELSSRSGGADLVSSVMKNLDLTVLQGQLAAGTCEIVTIKRDSSQPRRTIARQTARCACKKGQIAGTTRASPACVDARIIKTKQWCEMLPCLEEEGCDLLINKSGWTCTQPGGRIKTTTVS
ncbi:chemokine-like protein TAFA-5 isoform X1 [Ambystoma mexicanum]|uniref:chemokine-like protein TAFA-5 isoform X1 n=1 Tax=Ambystoma mexicanum TaxID=8296 RepID=UPI0037E92D49